MRNIVLNCQVLREKKYIHEFLIQIISGFPYFLRMTSKFKIQYFKIMKF